MAPCEWTSVESNYKGIIDIVNTTAAPAAVGLARPNQPPATLVIESAGLTGGLQFQLKPESSPSS